MEKHAPPPPIEEIEELEIHPFEKTFNAWKTLESKISSLKSIVQNDIPIPKEQLHEWEEFAATLINKVKALSLHTQMVVRDNNNKL